MKQPDKIQPKKIPVNFNDFGEQAQWNDVVGMICRKKGPMTVEACGQCPEFEPAVKFRHEGEGDATAMEGMDGIDPHTGNSYATCKYFGQIVRLNEFYSMVKREQEKKFGKFGWLR